MKEQEQEQSSLSPTEPIATSIEGRRESIPSDEVNIGGGDGVASVKVATVGLQPEIRNDSKGESMLTKGKDEEDEEEEGGSSGSEDDGQEDKKESDEDENEGDGNEDEGEGENEGGDDEVERGNTGKSIPGHGRNIVKELKRIITC
ncbi:hypothetical protein EDD11_007086 [Mortierella claussenii]|nr:hypothetical protein EDD11_007086 [Mortierella claussenii]